MDSLATPSAFMYSTLVVCVPHVGWVFRQGLKNSTKVPDWEKLMATRRFLTCILSKSREYNN